jgi:hypothetical protein
MLAEGGKGEVMWEVLTLGARTSYCSRSPHFTRTIYPPSSPWSRGDILWCVIKM